jgi:hypothetical protein
MLALLCPHLGWYGPCSGRTATCTTPRTCTSSYIMWHKFCIRMNQKLSEDWLVGPWGFSTADKSILYVFDWPSFKLGVSIFCDFLIRKLPVFFLLSDLAVNLPGVCCMYVCVCMYEYVCMFMCGCVCTGCGKLTSSFIWHFIFKKGS